MARVALDGMGGDFAPAAPVAGALLALSELDPEHRVQLIGREAVLREQLRTHLAGEHAALAQHESRIDFIDAADVIDMADKPTAALRGKPNSSMHVGLKLQVEGEGTRCGSCGTKYRMHGGVLTAA